MAGKTPRYLVCFAQRALAVNRDVNVASGIRVRPGEMLLDDFQRGNLAGLQSSVQLAEWSLRRVHACIVTASALGIAAQIVTSRLLSRRGIYAVETSELACPA
jgi:hypothetical protein